MSSWTDLDKQTVCRLWLAGASAGEIAHQVSRPGAPRSRNAVIGVVHRAGLFGRPSATLPTKLPIEPKPTRAVPRKPAAAAKAAPPRLQPVASRSVWERSDPAQRPPPPPLPSAPAATVVSRPLAELGRHCCRWPVGEAAGSEQLFCARPTSGRTYCAEHAQTGSDGVGKPLTKLAGLDGAPGRTRAVAAPRGLDGRAA